MPHATWCTFEDLTKRTGMQRTLLCGLLYGCSNIGIIGVRIRPETSDELVELLLLDGAIEYADGATFGELSAEDIANAVDEFDQDREIALVKGYEDYYEYMLFFRGRRRRKSRRLLTRGTSGVLSPIPARA